MAFVPFSSAVEAQMCYRQDGQQVQNTLYFDLGVIPGIPEMEELAEMLFDWYTEDVQPQQVAGVDLERILVTSLNSETAPGIEYTTGLPLSGTNIGSPLPNNVTAAVTFITGLRGRSYRGRNYVIGMNTLDVAGSTVEPGTRAAWEAIYDNLLAKATTAGFPWVVASRYADNAPREVGVITPIYGIRMEPTCDSQRRRLPGRGV